MGRSNAAPSHMAAHKLAKRAARACQLVRKAEDERATLHVTLGFHAREHARIHAFEQLVELGWELLRAGAGSRHFERERSSPHLRTAFLREIVEELA